MWMVVVVLVGFWGVGLFDGNPTGSLIHILLVYGGLLVTARLLEARSGCYSLQQRVP